MTEHENRDERYDDSHYDEDKLDDVDADYNDAFDEDDSAELPADSDNARLLGRPVSESEYYQSQHPRRAL